MTKFEELRKRMESGDDMKVINQWQAICDYLKEEEIQFLRMYYGIGCHKKDESEIADIIGMEPQQVKTTILKAEAKIERILEDHPEILAGS